MEQTDDYAAKAAIHDALLRYARGIDRGDVPMALSAFHPDARLRHGHVGEASPLEWVTFVISRPPIDRIGLDTGSPADDIVESQQHHVTNHHIKVRGNEAYSEAYFLEYTVTLRGTHRYLTSAGGRYVERYERREGDWRIIERDAVRDWDGVQLLLGRFPGWEKSPQGRRDRDDPSYCIYRDAP